LDLLKREGLTKTCLSRKELTNKPFFGQAITPFTEPLTKDFPFSGRQFSFIILTSFSSGLWPRLKLGALHIFAWTQRGLHPPYPQNFE